MQPHLQQPAPVPHPPPHALPPGQGVGVRHVRQEVQQQEPAGRAHQHPPGGEAVRVRPVRQGLRQQVHVQGAREDARGAPEAVQVPAVPQVVPEPAEPDAAREDPLGDEGETVCYAGVDVEWTVRIVKWNFQDDQWTL